MRCSVERCFFLDLSAASAVVVRSDVLHVVADDGTELALFDRDGRRVRTISLGLEPLPAEPSTRKGRKPDFEAIADLGDGRLGLFGSGSTDVRHRGCVVDLREGTSRIVDLAPLHRAIALQIRDLNLEGAVVRGDELLLAQRGNGAARANAIIILDARSAVASTAHDRIDPVCLREVVAVDVGDLDGVPLSITDLAIDARGRLWFAAAAEDTMSTYDDGVCVGSIVGRFDDAFRVVESARVPGRDKVEGLAFDLSDASGSSAFLVVDPDDASCRAQCMVVRFSA